MAYNSSIEADLSARIVLLMHGLLNTGGKFWCFVAVKPSRYEAFKDAYRTGKLDLKTFDTMGEVEEAGEGEAPPPDILLKIGNKYGITPNQLRAPYHPEAEVKALIGRAKQTSIEP